MACGICQTLDGGELAVAKVEAADEFAPNPFALTSVPVSCCADNTQRWVFRIVPNWDGAGRADKVGLGVC